MGRKKIKMKKIEEAAPRQVTFTKRRQGLMKKAMELSILCEVEIAVMVFSPAGRLFHYSSTPKSIQINRPELHAALTTTITDAFVLSIKDLLDKVTLNLDSLQLQQEEEKPVLASHEENKEDHAQLSKGVLDKIDLLREMQTEYLRHCTVEEVDQLGAKLDAIVETVSAKQANRHSYASQSGESEQVAVDVFPCSGETRWSPPPTNIYKVNFAGANIQDADVAGVGVGVVVRNWRGEFMAARGKYFPELADANIASWMAAKCAVDFAANCSFTRIMLECDSADTVRALQGIYDEGTYTSTCVSPPLQEEINEYIRQVGGACMVSLVQPSCNVAAQTVAKYAGTVIIDEAVWLTKAPDFLVAILLDELLGHNY